MGILRQLLISIGININRRSFNQANQSVLSLKTRLTLLGASAAYATRQLLSLLSGVAKQTLDTDALARTLGISLNDLLALQQAASQFRLSPENFSDVISQLNKDLVDAKQGFGNLFEYLRQRKIEINGSTDAIDLLKTILQDLSTIGNEQDRIRISSNFFGKSVGVAIADIAKNYDSFTDSVLENSKALSDQPDLAANALNFEKALNSLTIAAQKLGYTLSNFLFPIFEFIINELVNISELIKNVFDFNLSGIKKNLNAASRLLDPIFEKTGLSKVSTFFQSLYGGETILNQVNRDSFGMNPLTALGGAFTPTVTNNIDISVPYGTTEGQAQYISNELKEAVEESIMNTFYQIQNNNPQVE